MPLPIRVPGVKPTATRAGMSNVLAMAAMEKAKWMQKPSRWFRKRAIAALPGRKHVFTNGDIAHAERTLAALGFGEVFDATFDIVAAAFEPKPRIGAYERFVREHGVEPSRAVMFEDLPRNLEPAKVLHMTTVLVVPAEGPHRASESWEIAAGDESHIDHVTTDLAAFLRAAIA